MMKAIVIDNFVSSLSQIAPSEAPHPKLLEPRSLTIAITQAPLTHVDLLYAQGLHQNNRRHVIPPFILGTEFAGIVISSPALSNFRPGDRVFGSGLGGFAERICVPEGAVKRVPKSWSCRQAAAVGASGAVSWASLVKVADVKGGETVLVLGAGGGLGVIACQIALALGAKVIAVVGDGGKAKELRKLGVEDVVGYRNEGWEEKVKDLTEGKEGVEVVYDAVGKVESSLKCLKYGGRVVVVGFAGRNKGDVERIRVNRILLKAAKVVGYRFGEEGRRFPEETERVWNGFMEIIDKGGIKPVVYEQQYRGLGSVAHALTDIDERKVWGRAVVDIADEDEVLKCLREKSLVRL